MDASPLSSVDPLLAVPRLQRTSGSLDVVWRRRGDVTAAVRLFQDGAMKGRLPRDHGRGCPDVALINLAGGLTGGDAIDQRLTWEADTTAGATTQAAEKIYRAAEGTVAITTRLQVGPRAWAEWLPQETILFEGADLDRRLVVDLAPDARLLAVEPLVFGRLAMGERVRQVTLSDRIEIRVDGRLAWLDLTRLAPPVDRLLDAPALGDGARAVATLLYVAADAADRLSALREVLAETGVAAAATSLAPVLVARLHHAEPLALRRAVAHVLGRVRARFGDLPARLPRLWHT